MKRSIGYLCNGKIIGLREFYDDEYEKFHKEVKNLIDFSNKQQLFNIVKLNYDEFKDVLARYLSEYKNTNQINWAVMESMVQNINMLLLNFLSSFRTFLDHTEFMIKKEYGKDSEQSKKFKTICSVQYDNYLAYRFLYKLRNYAQHCGLPIGGLKLGSEAVKGEGRKTHEYLEVYFDRDILLSRYDSWGTVKAEIEKLPESIEITQFVNQLIKCIYEINKEVINNESDIEKIHASYEYLTKLIKPYKSYIKCLAIISVQDEKEHPKINFEWIPYHLLEMVENVI